MSADGIQHYEPREFLGGNDSFEKLKINDEIKNKYVENKPDLFLFRIHYKDVNKIDYMLNKIFANIEFYRKNKISYSNITF